MFARGARLMSSRVGKPPQVPSRCPRYAITESDDRGRSLQLVSRPRAISDRRDSAGVAQPGGDPVDGELNRLRERGPLTRPRSAALSLQKLGLDVAEGVEVGTA